MSSPNQSINVKDDILTPLSHTEKPTTIETEHFIKINLHPLKLPQHSPSNQMSTTEFKCNKKKRRTGNSITKNKTAFTETLGLSKQKSIAIAQSNKNYQKKCQALLNRIENLKKQETEIIKKMNKINKQKVSSAQIEVEKIGRYKNIALTNVDKEKEIVEKKEKAKQMHSVEKINIITAAQMRIEKKKQDYDKKKSDSKRAASQIIMFKQLIEKNKRQHCSQIRNNSVDLKKLKIALRESNEENRITSIEESIDKEQQYSEMLKKRLAELEKEEDKVFQHFTQTKQQNELMLQSGSHNTSLSRQRGNGLKSQGKTIDYKLTKTEESVVDQYKENLKNVEFFEERYNEKLKELNSLIEADKAFRSNNENTQ